MTKIYINTIVFNKSLVDGPGVRTLVFFQGCDIHCPFCQNKSTWDIKKGKEISVDEYNALEATDRGEGGFSSTGEK